MWIDPTNINLPWDTFAPDMPVFTLYGKWDLAEELGYGYADCCSTSESEAWTHFWLYTEGFEAEVKKETLREFLKRRKDETEMNPFATLNKWKTLSTHRHLWDVEKYDGQE
jgi:hypothetical protein